MKKLLTTLMLLSFTQLAFAGKFTPVTTITYLYIYDSGAVVKIKNKHKNEYGCSHSRSSEFLVLRYDTNNGKEKYAALLAAYMSSSKIRLAYSGCDGLWGKDTTLPKVYRVDIVK
jgi:hypothetical protein